MISRKTYCRALKLLQTQENLDAEARQILLTLLCDSIDDVCDYTSWWLSETDDFCVWTEDESPRWDLHKPEALYDFITGDYGSCHFVGTKAGHQSQINPFLFKISIFNCYILWGVEDGMCHFI